MRDGLYRVMFQTQFGRGSGVMHLQGGRMWGGDASMFYVGTYTEEKDGLIASVTVGRHTKKPMSRSVFGVDRVSITLSAKPAEGHAGGDTYNFTGTAAEAPRVSFTGMLQRVSD
jgi:hypothetical protein